MTTSDPIAHKSDDGRTQGLHDHLAGTAERSAAFASLFGSSEWGYLAGLWHDLGKYSVEFQRKIQAVGGENAHIEATARVDHSTAGAQHATKCLGGPSGKVLAYIIAGHHAGVPDGISTESCLRSRLDKQIPSYDECPKEVLEPKQLALPFTLAAEIAGVQISVLIRMLYSCLVDADFLDTEAFMSPEKSAFRTGYRTLTELEPVFFAELAKLRTGSSTSQVNSQRNTILDRCLSASEKGMGLFSLTVPTGGGKTLSSMAFALRHAKKHGLRRVIYVIPYTSIIEQNADVFRKFLGKDAVLEHHSNFEPEKEDHCSRLAAENWDAPIIVTTNVQFFESLFANRSSRCRKLHNIAQSVVILDEVQTLPPPYLLPCLEALKELSTHYRTSIVLCSATQPAVQKRSDFSRGLEGVREIMSDPQKLTKVMKRTSLNILPKTPDSELARLLAEHKQVLCVVNTRKHAKELYHILQGENRVHHLSALMCPAHRSQRLQSIRHELDKGEPCRVISTQLIEAGVDIDFPVVFRSLAGIDSIAQAAGRCNREGKRETGQVFVFTPEAGVPAGHFRQTTQAAESVIRRYSDDVLSLAAVEDYFRLYYWAKGDALDEEGILAMLNAGCSKGDFPFKTIAEKFRLIKEYMKPVVIPFDEQARELTRSIDFNKYPAGLSRKLQKYTVSIQPRHWDRLLSIGSISIKAGIFPVLVDEGLYEEDTGLSVDDPAEREPETLYI
jgi:CRISPR-associated endonuclease/helicase Cas3